MILAQPVENRAGAVLFGQGMELTEAVIRRLESMEIESICVEGQDRQLPPLEDMLADLDRRFEKTGEDPTTAMLKRVYREFYTELHGGP